MTNSSPTRNRLYGGRYRSVRLLKDGHGVDTWLGTDTTTGRDVVIKRTSAETVSAATLMRLEHEAAVLSRISAPGVTGLLGQGRQDEDLFLVAPYVQGITLLELLRKRRLSPREAIALASAVLTGLQHAHDHGILHRDVKPANVIVPEQGDVEGATLIDFGLARSTRLNPELRERPVGTALYVSPEQAGLIDHDVDERSDLYSVGVTVFESLTGRPPFLANTVGEVLRQHLTKPVPEFSELGVSAPTALEAILHQLLRKDPRDRYQSAEGVLADLEKLSEDLERGVADPRIVIGLQDRRGSLTEPAFVGRSEDLSTLEGTVEDAKAGAGGLVLLEAASGGGKTRLLDELTHRETGQDTWILRGQGLDQAAQRPFQLLVGVAAGVMASAEETDELQGLRERLGDEALAVVDALPELSGVLDREGGTTLGPEQHGETRSVRALASLLDALGTQDRPVVILLDDCQWADQPTMKVVKAWVERDPPRGRHTTIVAAFRTDEVSSAHPVRRLEPTAHLRLAPLSDDDVRALVESMAGPLPSEAVRLVQELAAGSPFMASAVIRGLTESGAIVHDADGWHTDPSAMASAQSSRQAAAFLVQRIRLLPDEAVRLLSVGAVIGKEFDLDLAASLAGLGAVDVIPALDEARRRQMVWARDDGSRCTFVHDKVRETFLELLPPDERRELHLQAARRIETLRPDDVFDLAYHFDAAGHPRRALPYAIEAGRRARAQHSLEIAEQQYEIAERGATDADIDVRRDIAWGSAHVKMLRGRYEDAASRFEEARALATENFQKAKIDAQLSELAFKRGDLATSSDRAESALGQIGRSIPKSSAGFLVRCLWEVVVQAFHSLFPSWFCGRRSLDGADRTLLAVRLYSRLAHVYWFERGSVPTLWVHLREMNLAERYPPTPELAQAYSEHAPVMTLIPWFSRGIAYVERSLHIRRALGDIWGQGQSLNFYGVVLYAASRYEECIERSREAARLLELTGDRWELNIARLHVAFALHRSGRLRDALDEATKAHRSGLEIGDPQASGIGLEIASKATCGKVPKAAVQTELARQTRDVQLRAEIMQAEAIRLVGRDRPDKAVSVLEEARRITREAGIKNEYIVPIWTWLATALREQAEQLPAVASRRRRRLLRRARRVARSATWLARRFRNNLPHALRERGLLEAMADHPKRSRRFLDASLQAAEAQGARWERAQTLVARGDVGLAYGWQHAVQDKEEGYAETNAVQAIDPADATPSVEPTLSLVDRFSALLDSGRRITSGLSREDVYDAVREAAMRLLRGDTCAVLRTPRGSAEDAVAVSGELDVPYSRTLLRQALTAGRPTAFDGGRAESTSESLELASARSALAAPILVRGRAELCLYVSHSGVTGLFGEDEERLAEFIATLGGAALENAEGFAEVRDLSRTLERRVQERTAELRRANAALDASVRKVTRAYEREKEVVRKLQELDELKSDFLSTVSHELRTPLTAIGGFTETLIAHGQRLERDSRAKFLKRIAANATELDTLISELLDFSRLERGHMSIDLAPYRLRKGVDSSIEKLDTVLGGREVRIEVPNDLRAMADPGVFSRVLENLLTNATKFSGADAPIQIAAREADGEVIVSVHDEGIGIPPDEQERIFDRFYRIERGDHAKAGGTGIGLAIVKEFVEAHGGRVWIESEPGAGSTFSFTLRRTDEHTDDGLAISSGDLDDIPSHHTA